jgi:hypothetical protein
MKWISGVTYCILIYKMAPLKETITAVEQQDWDGFAKNYRAFINEDYFHLSQTVEPRFVECLSIKH